MAAAKAAKATSCKNAAAAAALKIAATTIRIAAVNLTALQIWDHEKSNFIIIIL